MPYLVLIFLLLFSVAAPAWQAGGEPSFFAWIPPTQREDGSALPSSDIAAYILRCEKDGQPALTKEVGSGADDNWIVPNGTFGPGNWVCTLAARDKGALVSDDSLPVEFLVARYAFTVKPKAPTGVKVG